MSTLINTTFWPSSGDGYLLSTLAAVFVGGTPTWGGVGTIGGAVIGTFIVGFMQTGIIAAGLTGFYTQFFYGSGHYPVVGGPSLQRAALSVRTDRPT